MRHRLRWLPAGIAVLLVASPVTRGEDSLDQRMRAMAPDAVDCGRTQPGASGREAVLDCVRSQVRAGTPFRVRFDGTCIDAVCTWGLFRRAPSAALEILSYDPAGCSAENDTDVWCGTFGEVPCRDPQVTVKHRRVWVACGGYRF
jgi:hypothetical protein